MKKYTVEWLASQVPKNLLKYLERDVYEGNQRLVISYRARPGKISKIWVYPEKQGWWYPPRALASLMKRLNKSTQLIEAENSL